MPENDEAPQSLPPPTLLERRCSTIRQVRKKLKVGDSTVRDWLHAGALAAFRTPGGHWRIFVDEDGVPLAADGQKLPRALELAKVAA